MRSLPKIKRLVFWGMILFVSYLAFIPTIFAQVQRSIVNPSFEEPFTGSRATSLNQFFTRSDWISIDRGEINGWETSHSLVNNGCPAGNSTYGISAYNCNPIELWANNFIAPSLSGKIVAELNAYTASKLYQNVCFVNGEQFTFNFGHRGRTGVEEAVFEVGSTNILDVSTGNTGTIGTINSGGATSTSRTLVGTWTRYAGTYTYTGTSGIQQLGFRAIVPATGGVGNILDDININLKPYIEFQATSSSKAESATGTNNLPKFKLSGIIPAGGMTMTLNVSGTATYGTDYDFTGSTTLTNVVGSATTLTFKIPAGNYSDALANNVFDLPIKVINDNIIEANETVILTIPPTTSASSFVLASATTCGAAPNSVITHTIVDDDTDLQITKTGDASVGLNKPVSYSLTVKNNGPLAANGATFTDTVPTNITAVSAVCGTATGGAAGCLVTVSGNTISGSVATFPNGASQIITISGMASTVGNITNTATIAPPSGFNDPNCSLTTSVCDGNNTSSQNTAIFSPPNLVLNKSCPLPADCTTALQMPGTDLTYQIQFTNDGGQSASNLILVDRIPDNSDYKIGSATVTVGTTGLTFVIEYSSDYDPLNPTFATWVYTPVSGGGGAAVGYDRNVKAIRWQTTSGTLSNVSPNNTGNVSFITKIQ